jgi:hypothetical protein
MVTSSAGKRGYLSGQVFAAPYGTTDFEYLGDVESFSLAGTLTKAEGMNNSKPTRPVDEIIVVGERCTASMVLKEITPQNAAIALRASISTVATGSVTQNLTAPAVGGYISLSNPLISAVTSITSDPTGTTFVANTDYVLDLPSPMIRVPTGSALAGDPIIVNYTKAAATQVKAFKTSVNYYALRYVGKNSSNNQPIVADIFRVFFDPAQTNEMISQGNTLKSYSLNGDVLFDETSDGHYTESVPTPA